MFQLTLSLTGTKKLETFIPLKNLKIFTIFKAFTQYHWCYQRVSESTLFKLSGFRASLSWKCPLKKARGCPPKINSLLSRVHEVPSWLNYTSSIFNAQDPPSLLRHNFFPNFLVTQKLFYFTWLQGLARPKFQLLCCDIAGDSQHCDQHPRPRLG